MTDSSLGPQGGACPVCGIREWGVVGSDLDDPGGELLSCVCGHTFRRAELAAP